jgi:hypothetical protein
VRAAVYQEQVSVRIETQSVAVAEDASTEGVEIAAVAFEHHQRVLTSTEDVDVIIDVDPNSAKQAPLESIGKGTPVRDDFV